MRSLYFGRHALSSCVTAAMLSACSGSQPPIGAAAALPQSQTHAIAAHGSRGTHNPAYVYVGECCHFYNTGAVALYDLALTEVVRTITKVSTPDYITIDRSGRLYTINRFHGSVTEYDRGSEEPSRRIKLRGSWAAATDSSNILYVASCISCLPYQSGNGSVDVYKAGTTKLLRSITKGIDSPVSVAIDTDDDLYVANNPYSHPAVTVYAPGASKPLRRLAQGLAAPTGVALDPSNDLFVMNDPVNGSPSIVEYEAASNKVLRTITSGVLSPQAIAVDGSGTLYVANVPGSSRGWISVYASGVSTPAYKIKSGVDDPQALTVDGEGNLYVGNNGPDRPPRYLGTVCVYASNTRTPLRCVRGERRFDNPSWLAVSR
jgi:DNA-binding beta-propeller fold protein YncE